MSQVIDLCEGSDSDDKREWTASNTAPDVSQVPSHHLPFKKRRLSTEESSDATDAHPNNGNIPGNNKTTIDEVEVASPQRKRRGVVRSEQSGTNDVAGERLQILKGLYGEDALRVDDREFHKRIAAVSHQMNSYSEQTLKGLYASKKGVGVSEDAQVADHCEFHKRITAAVSHPMNSYSEQTLKGVYATKKGVGISKDALAVDHCEFHKRITAAVSHSMNSYSEQTRRDDGSAFKDSQKSGRERESPPAAAVAGGIEQVVDEDDDSDDSSEEEVPYQTGDGGDWATKFTELCEYRNSKGQCKFHCEDPEYVELSRWVFSQRCEYRRMVGGKDSILIAERIALLEGIGFAWNKSSRPTWEERLVELADYRKIHGHCNVPKRWRVNSKLGKWVGTQRTNYKLYREGKTPSITTLRIQELENLGFEWVCVTVSWEDRLIELADFRKINGHCNVPKRDPENHQLGKWVGTQRSNYWSSEEKKREYLTPFRIQELESLGFEWKLTAAVWEDRLIELAAYRKIHGHCNVPKSIGEHSTLGNWVAKQRSNYRLHGKRNFAMTPFRVRELESLGFEWESPGGVPWEDRLIELADYRKTNGHCNVPKRNDKYSKLAKWVGTQRTNYWRERSPMTTFRIQELENLGFNWRPGRKKETPRKRSRNDGATRVRERAVESPEHMQQHSLKKIAAITKSAAIKSTPLSKPKNPTGMAKATSTSTQVEAKKMRGVEAGDARFDETDLDLVAKPNLLSDRQAAKKLVNSRQSAESQLETAPSNAIFTATGYH
jgi:hypothetical protein